MTETGLLRAYLAAHDALRQSGDAAGIARLFAPDGEMHFAGISAGPFLGGAAIEAAFRASPPDDDLVGRDFGGEGAESWCGYDWKRGGRGALVLREEGGAIARLIVTGVPEGAAEDEAAYLATGDPRGQSGFRGDARRWTALRRVVVTPVTRDGRFLDIGCANGLLMESIAAWTAEAGLRVEPWGVDVSAAHAALARARLPAWADRIATANAEAWEPPGRFEFVRTEIVYTKEPRAYLARIAERFLAPRGRLVVCSYESARVRPALPGTPGEWLRGWGFDVKGEARADQDPAGRGGATRVAWIENG